MRPTIRLCSAFLLAPLFAPISSAQESAPPKQAPAVAAEAGDQSKARQLSPEMLALRDELRRAVVGLARQTLNTRDNTPADIMEACRAFGSGTNVIHGAPGKKVNGLGCLCWNYLCGGYQLLVHDDDRFMARIGYGLQADAGQFLAVLAITGVPADYEIRAGDAQGTVADLVEFEKRACRSGSDRPFALIGLSYYLDDGATWQNEWGEDWSIERLVREELARSCSASTSAVTCRLMGLSYAVDRRRLRKLPIEGVYADVEAYLDKFHEHALSLQNADGSWHPTFFARQGTSNDTSGVLRSTGHILEWLVFSLPEDRLSDVRVVRSVGYLSKRLGAPSTRANVSSMSHRDLQTTMRAARALVLYDRRAFAPGLSQVSAR